MNKPEHYKHLKCFYNIPYESDPTAYASSRDYNLPCIPCQRTWCHINKHGKCGMASAISINAAGVCITGSAYEMPKEKPATLRNPRPGD